jgi:hypothetical protein
MFVGILRDFPEFHNSSVSESLKFLITEDINGFRYERQPGAYSAWKMVSKRSQLTVVKMMS